MRLFGLIGHPLTHSFSQKYFMEKFEKENVSDALYKLFPIEDVSFFDELCKQNEYLQGLNVTIPYKEKIIPYLDGLSPSAEKVGAVNVIKLFRECGKIRKIGFNTDLIGFRNSLRKYLNPSIKRALILGTGGASKAVAFGLEGLGIDYRFVSRFPKYEDDIAYSALTKEIVEESFLIVNTTPLGTFPQENTYPDIPYDFLTSKHILFDLVYNPAETLFMLFGKQNKAQVVNGYEMLTLQAEESWKIWNQ